MSEKLYRLKWEPVDEPGPAKQPAQQPKQYSAYVLVQFRGVDAYVYKMLSDQKIPFSRVHRYFKEAESLDDERDTIATMQTISELDLDKAEARLKKQNEQEPE